MENRIDQEFQEDLSTDPAEKLQSLLVLNSSNSSTFSAITDQLVVEASNIPKRLYCPFCLFDFGFDFLLKSHIREVHPIEITNFSKTIVHTPESDTCSYCYAKFYVAGLLPKHVIRKHQECILNLISSFEANKNLSCNFCPYQVSCKQMKLLFIHLENKHLNDFSQLLSTYKLAMNGIVRTPNKSQNCFNRQTSDSNASIDDISDETRDIGVRLKPILKKGSLYSHALTNNVLEGKGTPQIGRKLRFNLPDNSLSSVDSDKENSPLRNISKKVISLKIKKCKKRSEKSKPIINIPSEKRNILGDITGELYESYCNTPRHGGKSSEALAFKCGVCSEKFHSNFFLLSHVKKKHGKINFHPPYRCGLCKAKFFRNSFLIRHTKLHSEPKCLYGFEYEPL